MPVKTRSMISFVSKIKVHGLYFPAPWRNQKNCFHWVEFFSAPGCAEVKSYPCGFQIVLYVVARGFREQSEVFKQFTIAMGHVQHSLGKKQCDSTAIQTKSAPFMTEGNPMGTCPRVIRNFCR